MSQYLNLQSFSSARAFVLFSLVGFALAGCGGGGGGGDATPEADKTASVDTPVENHPDDLVPYVEDTREMAVAEAVSAPVALASTTLDYMSQINLAASGAGQRLDNLASQVGADGTRVTGWAFSNGAEFVGAQGQLALRTTSGLPQAELQADLGCNAVAVVNTPAAGCGKYVAAIRYLSSPVAIASPSTARIQMRFRLNEPMFNVALRMQDSTNQTLQYNVPTHTLESAAGGAWTQVAVPVTQVANYWGGSQSGVLQGSVKEMSMLLTQKSLVGPRGTMTIDDIRLLPGNTSELALNGDENVISEGVNPSLNGRMAVTARYYKVSDSSLRLASEAGFSVVRVDMFWETVERNGVFDFSIYNTVLNRLAARGMKALFILNYGHPDHGRGAPMSTQDREAFLQYARKATEFAKGRNVIGFEVWNEPDNSQYWSNASPVSYAQLLEPTRAAVKAIDPTRVVMNGGTSWINLPYINDLAKTGQLAKVDAVAVHPYRKTSSPESFGADLASLRFMLKSQGVQAPVVVTEWGHSSAGLAADIYGNGSDPRARSWQMRMVLRSQLTQIALNLPLMTTYEMVDSGTDPNHLEHNFGLVNSNLQPKPAYVGLKQLYTLIKDKAYQGLVRDVPPNVHAMRWKGGNRTVYAVWVDAGSLSATVTVPGNAKVLNWDGSVRGTAVGAQETRNFTMNRDEGVLYVVL